MAAKTKFFMIGGDLYYAKTGAKVRRQLIENYEGNYSSGYVLKENASGVTMVYNEKGRLIGYAGKPKTAAERKKYEAAEARLQKKPFMRAANKETARRRGGPTKDKYLTPKEYEEQSFQKALKGAFDAGIITSTEAEIMYQQFKEGSKYSRYGLWDELKLRDQIKGHPYFQAA